MNERVVYEFPPEWPFRLQLVAGDPQDPTSNALRPWRLVRQGLYSARILLSDLDRQDLEALADSVTEELWRT